MTDSEAGVKDEKRNRCCMQRR